MKARKHGFTLTEVLVVLTLMALVFISGLFLSRGSLTAVQTRSVADLVAQVLRTARDTAMAERQCVSVALPSAAGGSPLSQSLYRLVGEHLPRVTQVVRLDRDYPDATLFAGWWTHPTATRARPVLGDLSDQLDVASLGLPEPQDPTLIFCPNGAVRSNGWPRVQESYQLVVTNGATWTDVPPPGDPALTTPAAGPRLTAASRAHTITISPLGEIRVTPGLPGNTDVALTDQPLPRPATMPTAPPVAGPPASGPSITSVTVTPSMDKLTLPTGVQALITTDGYLSLTVLADSPAGCPLYCQWTVATGQGAVSGPGEQRMEWESTGWVSRWSWRAPPGAVNDDQFHLSCQVRDSYGNVASATTTSEMDVAVTKSRPRVAFATDQGLYSVNQDATGLRRLTWTTTAVPDRYACYAPEGQEIVYAHGFAPPTFGELTLADDDGSDARVLSSNLAGGVACTFNPAGTRLAWIEAATAGLGDVFVAWADGSHKTNLTNTPEQESFACPGHGFMPLPWLPRGSQGEIVAMRNGHVRAFDVATAADRDLTPAGNARYPSFSPNGQWCAYNTAGDLWLVAANVDPPPAAIQLTSTGGTVEGASCFSPDSDWVYYLKNVAWDPYGGVFEVRRVRRDGTSDSLITGGKNMTMLQFFPGTTSIGFIGPTSAGTYNLQGMSETGAGVCNLTNLKAYKWMHGMTPASF